MKGEQEHKVWVEQVQKLISSNRELQETDSTNILCHFFSQVIERDFHHELEPAKQYMKKLARMAVELAGTLAGSNRERAAAVLSKCTRLEEPVLDNVRLNDLRNVVVFEMFKRCGVTTDTYFERYSSPPGTEAQSSMYLNIAHGKAKCTAAWTEKLSFVVNAMHLLKTVFLVYDLFMGQEIPVNEANLNWHGEKWTMHVSRRGLGDLVWNLFLDVWEYEHSVYK